MSVRRGHRKLYQSLFGEEEATEQADKKKGRNADLLRQRDELLVARYVYYRTYYRQYSYEYIMQLLSKEFFLTTVSVPQYLNELYPEMEAMKKDGVTKTQLRKKWPWIVWS